MTEIWEMSGSTQSGGWMHMQGAGLVCSVGLGMCPTPGDAAKKKSVGQD